MTMSFNSAVVLLMLLIAAWRTMPVLSHLPAKPTAGSEINYGGRAKAETNKPQANTPDPELTKAAGEAAVLLKAKEELSKRMVKHIETVITSPQIVVPMKLLLLIKSAEFMRAMADDVAGQMAKVGQQHETVASADLVAALRLQQEALKKSAERCKAVAADAAMPQKEKNAIINGVGTELSTVAGNLAISMSTLAEEAIGVTGKVAASADINARVEIESKALAKAETIAVVEAIADAKAMDKAENEAIAGAEATGGAGGEAKASKSSSFSAGGDAAGYAGGKTDAAAATSAGGKAEGSDKADGDAATSAGGKAEGSDKADSDATAAASGEAEASKSSVSGGDAGGSEGGKTAADASTSGGSDAGGSGKADADASAGAGGETKESKSSSGSASGDAGGYAGGKAKADAPTSGGGKAGGSGKADGLPAGFTYNYM